MQAQMAQISSWRVSSSRGGRTKRWGSMACVVRWMGSARGGNRGEEVDGR